MGPVKGTSTSIGGFAGTVYHANGGSIRNCTVDAQAVNCTGGYVGGFAGHNLEGRIRQCFYNSHPGNPGSAVAMDVGSTDVREIVIQECETYLKDILSMYHVGLDVYDRRCAELGIDRKAISHRDATNGRKKIKH